MIHRIDLPVIVGYGCGDYSVAVDSVLPRLLQ